MVGSMHLFKNMGTLTPENIKLIRNITLELIELDLKEVNMTLNGNKINLPKSVSVNFRDKFKIRHIVKREPLLFHIMLKQGLTWFTLTSNNPQETVQDILDILPEMGCDLEPTFNFLFGYFSCTLPEDMINVDITVHTLKGIHTFRNDQSMQVSRFSLWGAEVKLFPSLRKKMKDYIEECQAIANPFIHSSLQAYSPHQSQNGLKLPKSRK